MQRPYADIKDPLILRDHLALDRTAMAVERTFLAYLRTALAMVVAGASALHFLHTTGWQIVGVTLVVTSVLLTLIGGWRSIRVTRLLRLIRSQNVSPRTPPAPQ